MADKRQETLWVLRAQLGARDALQALFQSIQEPLYRYIVHLVSDEALAEDILQDVLLRIYRKLRWLREPELFRPWAYRIASREAFRAVRRLRRWPEADAAVLEELPAPPDRSEMLRDWERRLPRLLETVSPASRAVLVLHYLQEMTLEDVAAVLGVPLGTVKSRLAYGLQALRGAPLEAATR